MISQLRCQTVFTYFRAKIGVNESPFLSHHNKEFRRRGMMGRNKYLQVVAEKPLRYPFKSEIALRQKNPIESPPSNALLYRLTAIKK